MFVFFRSLLFWCGLIAVTIFYFLLIFPLLFLPLDWRRKVIMTWADVMLAWLQWCCNIHYTVQGKEHIPDYPCIIVSNHESAWETIAYQMIFPKHLWVLKRELLYIPLFGWALKLLNPIAINRGDRAQAMKQISEQGRRCFEDGLWLLIFPQGTRLPPEDTTPYKPGAARVSVNMGIPLLPATMNAWHVWPRNSFIKRPGLVKVVIGPPIHPQEREPEVITQELEQWIRSHRPQP